MSELYPPSPAEPDSTRFVFPPDPEEQWRDAPDNREQLYEVLNERIAYTPGNFALVIMDLDGLKDINDAHGHAEGDAYLEYVRTLLNDMIRRPDTLENRKHDELVVIHINGDEFCVVLGNTNTEGRVQGFITRMQRELPEYGVEASMGGLVHTPGTTATEIYTAADKLLQINDDQRKLAAFAALPEEDKQAILAHVEAARRAQLSLRKIASIGEAILRQKPLE